MEPAHRQLLIERSRPLSARDGDVIAGPADGKAAHLYIVVRGAVTGERGDIGETLSLGEGECFPVGALLGERPTRTTYRARGDATCFRLPAEDFSALIAVSEPFRDFCLRGVSSLLDRLQKQIRVAAVESLGADAPLETPLGELVRGEPLVCSPQTSVREAVTRMHRGKVGSIVVVDPDGRPLGIFTLHDLRAVVADASIGLEVDVEQVMSRDLRTLPAESFAFEAVVEMVRHHVRHLPVMAGNRLVGVVSERDIFALQRVNVVQLMRGINRATDLDGLVAARRGIRPLIDAMLAHGADTEHLTRIITLLNDRTVERVVDLGLSACGDPGVAFCWIAFGSEGRGEQTLVTDQDNGILFHAGDEAPDDVRRRLLPLARWINEALAVCGFPLCPGNIMASNPELCLSAEEWRATFRRLVEQCTPENLLRSTIYFDLRPVWGNADPVESLIADTLETTASNSIFLHMMAANALSHRPPLGMIRDFATERAEPGAPATLDLKMGGLTPFVDAARLMSLETGVAATGTLERFKQLADAGIVNAGEAEAWSRSFSFIQLLRMRRHQEQGRRGEPMTNRLDPDELNPMDRRVLKEAFRQGRALQRKLEVRYGV
jgi:CBS domain-containing protein